MKDAQTPIVKRGTKLPLGFGTVITIESDHVTARNVTGKFKFTFSEIEVLYDAE